MMLFGVGSLRKMPVDVFPEFAPPRVEIQTPASGCPRPRSSPWSRSRWSRRSNGVAGLDVMRSKSAAQLSYDRAHLQAGTDLMHARQLVAGAHGDGPAHPADLGGPAGHDAAALGDQPGHEDRAVLDTMSLEDMSMTAYWKIRARLLRVPGVANIAIWGERIKAYQVQVEPQKLAANGVSLDQVMEVTADALDAGILKFAEGGFIGTGGFIETPNQRLGVRHELPIVTPEDLAQVASSSATARRCARRRGHAWSRITSRSPATRSSTTAPASCSSSRSSRGATRSTSPRASRRRIDEMRPGLPGHRRSTRTIFRPGRASSRRRIHNLTASLLLGALLVVLVLGAVPLRLAHAR